jgi:hypothetical protein
MNTRQLSQGMLPTIEFEQEHTFKSLRHFPDLRMTKRDISDMKTKRSSNLDRSSPTLGIVRSLQFRSTHKLDELSRSSLDNVGSSMSDFRKILLENRKRNKLLLPGERPRASDLSLSSSSSLSSVGVTETGTESLVSDPLSIANQKLTKVSVSFDALALNSHLAGFAGSKLNKSEFEIQLRRCINVNLKKAELDALFRCMDEDDSDMIDGVEFVRYFFKLGNEARWSIFMDTKNIQLKKEVDSKRRKEEDLARRKKWESEQITSFVDEDYESAMRKLADAAFRFDSSSYVDSVTISGFEAFLTPFEFKMQVERSFNLKMTGAEVSHCCRCCYCCQIASPAMYATNGCLSAC